MKVFRIFLLMVLCFIFTAPAFAFQEGGCGAGDCRDCHALSKSQASNILKGMGTTVHEVKLSEVPRAVDYNCGAEGEKIPALSRFFRRVFDQRAYC